MKAILFDAGNTLVWLDHAYVVALLAEHGVESSDEALMGAEYRAKRLMDEMARGGNGLTGEQRGVRYFAEIFGQIGVRDELLPALAKALLARHAERGLWSIVRERTAETLETLRASGYRLGVVSNADGGVEKLLVAAGLRPYFELVIDSSDVGLEKPDPRIFHLACERMGVAPAEAAYVGDIYEIDVEGARAAGLRPFLIDPLDRWTEHDCERIAALHELPARLEAR